MKKKKNMVFGNLRRAGIRTNILKCVALAMVLSLLLSACASDSASKNSSDYVSDESETQDTQSENASETADDTAEKTASNTEEAVSTAESSDDESDSEIVDKFEYKYDENNNITVGILKDIETYELEVMATGLYTENNIGLMQDNFIWVWMYPFAKSTDVSFVAQVGDETYGYLMNEGEVLMHNIPVDDIENVPEEFAEKNKEMHDSLNDFYVKYGLADKTYNTLVYEDENVKIYFTGISDDGVEFNVENLSDGTIMIQASTLAINGKSTNDIIMSDRVAALSSGTIIARCDDFADVEEISTITGELRIISDNWDSYNANFVNVNAE